MTNEEEVNVEASDRCGERWRGPRGVERHCRLDAPRQSAGHRGSGTCPGNPGGEALHEA